MTRGTAPDQDPAQYLVVIMIEIKTLTRHDLLQVNPSEAEEIMCDVNVQTQILTQIQFQIKTNLTNQTYLNATTPTTTTTANPTDTTKATDLQS